MSQRCGLWPATVMLAVILFGQNSVFANEVTNADSAAQGLPDNILTDEAALQSYLQNQPQGEHALLAFFHLVELRRMAIDDAHLEQRDTDFPASLARWGKTPDLP